MRPILVTGFGPFRDWAVNSSWDGVLALAAARPGIAARRLTVDHESAAAELRFALDLVQPRAVLLTGLAPDPVLRIEMRARRGPLSGAGPVSRGARWPVARALRRLTAAGLPVRLSRDAGLYVCETTYWAGLGATRVPVLFLHVPPPGPSWPPRRLARAMGACLDVLEG